MQLEYLEDAAASLPRVLLAYGNSPTQALLLRNAAEQLANEQTNHVQLDELPGFTSVDGCTLAAQLGPDNLGVAPIPHSDRDFTCVLNPAGWHQVAGLLEPFTTAPPADQTTRYAYLADDGPILWIVSTDRHW